MKKLLLFFLLFFLFFFPEEVFAQDNNPEEVMEGEVVSIVDSGTYSQDGQAWDYQRLEIEITKGSLEGENIVVENGRIPTADYSEYSVGDKLVLTKTEDVEGNETFLITDQIRRDGLIILFILFAISAIMVGQIWGITSLVGMAFSFLVIFKFILPQILDGRNAVFIAIIGSALIIPVTFTLSHGIKKKTLIAGIGTIISLVITGLIAVYFVEITHLTGFAEEESGFLQFELGNRLNMKGILLAGIIIASLGILDDITISQASVVEELKKANKKLKPYEIFSRAMNVGRDHIASLINTLVLVYTGASLPLLLLFINSPRSFSEVINYEIVADEIVRTLVGSIGLVLAVPITTAIAVYYYEKAEV